MKDIQVPPPPHVKFTKAGRAYMDINKIIDRELARCECPAPGVGKEYRCDDEKGTAFPSHCPCKCHKP